MSICVIKTRAFARVLAISLFCFLSSAHAASITYTLDQSNGLPDGIDYISVTISDSNTIAGAIDFEINVITSSLPELGSNFGVQSFYFNFDSSLDVDAANITNLDPGAWKIRENRNAGGSFGKFDFALTGNGRSRTELLTFSIDGVDGDTVQSYAMASLLNPGSGQFFAAHLAGFSSDPFGVSSAKIAGSTLAAIPLPAAAWYFISALGFLGWVRNRAA